MPHQYGLSGYAQSPPSPPSQHGAIIPRIGAGGAVVPAGTGSAHGTNTTQMLRQIEDRRLTRDAMERYLSERSDMVLVILHAKVRFKFFQTIY